MTFDELAKRYQALSELTLEQLIAARDSLAPKLKREQAAEWYEVRRKYLAYANEIAVRMGRKCIRY